MFAFWFVLGMGAGFGLFAVLDKSFKRQLGDLQAQVDVVRSRIDAARDEIWRGAR